MPLCNSLDGEHEGAGRWLLRGCPGNPWFNNAMAMSPGWIKKEARQAESTQAAPPSPVCSFARGCQADATLDVCPLL